jgi:NADP-dependent 3-hydroxy acid dehydrogenase YdfG
MTVSIADDGVAIDLPALIDRIRARLGRIAVVRAVLPEMIDRGDGGILFGQGISGVRPMPGSSGPAPAMAAARNYVHSLHGELAEKGVYAVFSLSRPLWWAVPATRR